MGRRLSALFFVVLAGCSSPPATVKVPVPVPCPAPPATHRPHLPIADLGPGAPPREVMRAYAGSVEACTGYATELEAVLDGYRRSSQQRDSPTEEKTP